MHRVSGASSGTPGRNVSKPTSSLLNAPMPMNWLDGPVRRAWELQLPADWPASTFNNPSPVKKKEKAWTPPQKPAIETPQKIAEAAASAFDSDEITPPKDVNGNAPPRRHAHSRMVATPQQAHIQGPIRSKNAPQKDAALANTPGSQAKRAQRPSPGYPGDAPEASLRSSGIDFPVRLPKEPAPESAVADLPSRQQKPVAQAVGPVCSNGGFVTKMDMAQFAAVTKSLGQEPLTEFSVSGPRLNKESATKYSIEGLPTSIRNALMFIRNVPALPCTPPGSRPAMLPPVRPDKPQRQTLVLDLDETLVHCSRSSSSRSGPPPANPDLIVQFEDPPTSSSSSGLVVFRPHVHHFLKEVAKAFEVVIFTASQQSYADKVINALDPDGTLIDHRLYRQHCTEHRGAFFKELSLLGRPLSQCILVDNSPISVACNGDNSILCRSWYGGECKELLDMLALFKTMQTHGDGNCGHFLCARYGLREYFQGLREAARHPQV